MLGQTTSYLESISRQRLATILFDQQIWCWGTDIEQASGNLLVKYGFQRIEKPVDRSAVSLYRWSPSQSTRIVLRGFGVFCGIDRQGGVFVSRERFVPRLTPASDFERPAWCRDDLPPLSRPKRHDVRRCQSLLLTMIDAIVDYELWVARVCGIEHRRDSLKRWSEHRKLVVDANKIVSVWREVQNAVLDCPEEFIA